MSSLGRTLHGQRRPAGIGGKGIERCRDRTTNPSPEETLPAVFLTLLSQFPFWAGIPSKDLLMRFVVLFTSSSPEWLAGGVFTVSLAPRPVSPDPSLLAHELHASLKTLPPLSLLLSADLLRTLPGLSEPSPGPAPAVLASFLSLQATSLRPSLLAFPQPPPSSAPSLRC